MYALVKKVLFLFPAETAHRLAMTSVEALLAFPGGEKVLRRLFALNDPKLEKTVFGIRFPNPVGLAAGFDKNGRHLRALAALGFGFVEVGTVTPLPQEGNPRPRLFRLPLDRALINRMGFNNDGLDALIARLADRPPGIVIGGNIGKNKSTPNELAQRDYEICFDRLFPYVDYFAVNVSSPNTPGLRELQEKEPLARLLGALQARNLRQPLPKPILLKIAPDLTKEQLDDILDIVRQTGIAGMIATNTTVGRTGLRTPADRIAALGAGGLSGDPVRERSTEVVRYLHRQSGGQIPIVAVGGISSPESAQEKMAAGASLVQVYTGFVYEGPGLVRRILRKFLG
jgi:dihydroorotate dehydrogenase